ncbi:MAG: hypothetical protein PHE54_04005, partial [Bacilli bacterium]|nr:hypothetical protein [Bacilli bacterium]
MNLKKIDNLKKLLQDKKYDFDFYARQGIDLKVVYDKENDIFTAKVYVAMNGKQMINTSISFNKDADVLPSDCLICDLKDCNHLLFSYYIVSLKFHQILNYFQIKTSKNANDLVEVLKQNNHPKQLSHISLVLNLSDEKVYLDIKIGQTKEYLLRRKINEFMEAYHSKNGTVVFGNDYVYDASIHYFKENDKQILDVLSMILPKTYNYNKEPLYNTNLFLLSDEALKILLTILKENKHAFKLHINNQNYQITQIETVFEPKVDMYKKDEQII